MEHVSPLGKNWIFNSKGMRIGSRVLFLSRYFATDGGSSSYGFGDQLRYIRRTRKFYGKKQMMYQSRRQTFFIEE